MGARTTRKKKHREPLTRERVLSAAIVLADADGVEGLSMRRLAGELGVEAMSLYHHVQNKDEILSGIVDLVYAELELPRDGDWRAAIRGRATSMRAALARHPWALPLLSSRTQPGPATLSHLDGALEVFRGAGFSLPLTAHAISLVDSYVFGFAVQEANLPLQSEAQTAEVAAGMLEQMRGAFPRLAELTVEHVLQPGYRYADEFDFGLEFILDGLDRLRSAAPIDAPSTGSGLTGAEP